ncbi:TetR/AcrR family transcriptional regulator [Actinomadura verrucosospora]|uniref:Transcriptional regulator, TetR family n=1 Tax=Actinomadura verrucosospora TaxID=46165 RepID=A0A7D3VXL7_ACTVE|nr:TetR/AcrR family transcriptional regulator [Actinomadura verrucosospora]QKG21576.1 transcriptional regulator, TetR family [Actinomadura verrucosospora]
MSAQRPYGGVKAVERRAQRRAALLGAAFEIIGAQGLDKLTVGRLCARAGLNERYYYEHFDGRDAVLSALLDALAEELTTAITRALDATRGADPRTVAHAAIAAGVGVLADDPRKGKAAQIIASASPESRVRTAQTITAIADLVASSAAGRARPATTALRFRAGYLVGGLVMVLGAWLQGQLAMTREELIDHTTDVFVLVTGDLR